MLLIVSGAIMTIVQVESPGLILTSTYGRLLASKLLLVSVLLGIAAWNRRRLSPALAAGQPHAARHLRRMIATELVIMLAIFGVVAGWRFTPPPRVLLVTASRPIQLHIHTARGITDLKFMAIRPGLYDVEISVLDGEFGPLEAKEISLAIESKEAGIEAIIRPAIRTKGTSCRIRQFPIPQGGTMVNPSRRPDQ